MSITLVLATLRLFLGQKRPVAQQRPSPLHASHHPLAAAGRQLFEAIGGLIKAIPHGAAVITRQILEPSHKRGITVSAPPAITHLLAFVKHREEPQSAPRCAAAHELDAGQGCRGYTRLSSFPFHTLTPRQFCPLPNRRGQKLYNIRRAHCSAQMQGIGSAVADGGVSQLVGYHCIYHYVSERSFTYPRF